MSFWAIAALLAFVAVGILLRLRFGNLYRKLVEALEARSGLDSKTATVVVWLVVAFTADEASRGGLEALFEWFRVPKEEPEAAP